ncbi:MAG: cytochrome-c peroxidase [Gemmatimonadales bacterium]
MSCRTLATPIVVAAALLAGCSHPDTPTSPAAPTAEAHRGGGASSALASVVRQLAKARGVTPLERPQPVRPALARLGQMLVFDKVLSGNRDISCMTCHLPGLATGDARSLSIGQGASGLGLNRIHPTGAFIPRNAPSLFNLHALQSLFWDGRVSVDAAGRFQTPAGSQLSAAMTRVFEFGPVSALGMFPVLSREEMRATGDNELAAIPDDDRTAIWQALMSRLGAIPEYRRLFEEAYPGTRFRQMTFAHASNAMAGFLLDRLTVDDTPWDRFLAGNDRALSEAELVGAQTFMSIRCSLCHNGPAFTDNQFHNVALAQFGPGEGDGAGGRDDFGRERVTGNATDRYRFRTTPLRNVALTGPYGHDGAIADLHDFIGHYSESDVKLRAFDPGSLEPLLRGTVLPTAEQILTTRDTIIRGVVLPDSIVDQLTTFMGALTSPRARLTDLITPRRVPSRLPVDRLGRAEH